MNSLPGCIKFENQGFTAYFKVDTIGFADGFARGPERGGKSKE